MSKSDFVFSISRRNRDARSDDIEDLTFTSDRASLKVNLRSAPDHTGVIEHTYGSNPGAGITRIVQFEHGYEYTPATMVLIHVPFARGGPTRAPYREFFKTPFTADYHYNADFTLSSYSVYEAYADRRYFYVDFRRVGTTWDNISGNTIYIKYNILDIQGME